MNNREQFLQKLTALLKLAGANIRAIEVADEDYVNVVYSDGEVRRVSVVACSDIEVISEILDELIYGYGGE